MTEKTLQDALKALFYSLGGNADAVRDTDDIITILGAMAGLAIGKQLAAAKELPKVTAENNGQVLTVVSGAWKAANAAKELPTVAAGDDGKVLTVVSGAWAAAALPADPVEQAET